MCEGPEEGVASAWLVFARGGSSEGGGRLGNSTGGAMSGGCWVVPKGFTSCRLMPGPESAKGILKNEETWIV
jgi:hypothetical protein